MIFAVVKLLLLVITSSSISRAGNNFYLSLKPYDDLDWEAGSGLDASNSTTCTSQGVQCSCGDPLRRARDEYEREISSTCCNYDIVEDNSSIFSFCADSLQWLSIGHSSIGQGYKIIMVDTVVDDDDLLVFNESTLEERIKEVESYLRVFKNVLDRTTSGVLAESDYTKCFCFDRYKKWLCTTHLPFYANASEYSNCDNTSGMVRLKPCIGVCHDVLQSCPYYNPLRYQLNSSPQKSTQEIIYGGYPSFDCPSELYKSSEYLFNCNKTSRISCIVRKDSAGVHDSSKIIVMFSILFFLLIIRTII